MNPEELLARFQLDYQGYASANAETLEALSKALTAGSGVDAASYTGGRALTPESLDTTLVNILFQSDEARLFQRIKKNPVKSVIHQWDVRTEVGADDGAWVGEGGTSQQTDQTIARKFVQAKYLQTQRQVTLQAAASNMIENAINLEVNAGMLWLIRNIEKSLWNGNSTNFPLQPDGMDAQIDSNLVFDLRGADATGKSFEDKLNEMAAAIRQHYGKPTTLFSSVPVARDIQYNIRDRVRFNAGSNPALSGVSRTYPSIFGDFELVDDIFITEGGPGVTGALSSLIPTVPTISSAAAASGTDGKFTAADAGTYYYGIVASNQYGDSVVVNTASVTIAATNHVAIGVTAGATVGTAYKVYRSKIGGSTADMRYMFTVPYASSPQTITDLNSYLPGCSSVYLLTMDPLYAAIEWEQFLPAMRFPLYPTASAVYPFLMLLFGALAVLKPVQHARLINVQPSNLGWF